MNRIQHCKQDYAAMRGEPYAHRMKRDLPDDYYDSDTA